MRCSEIAVVRTSKVPDRVKSCRAKTCIYCWALKFYPAVINWIHNIIAFCHSLKLRPYSIPECSTVSLPVFFIYMHITFSVFLVVSLLTLWGSYGSALAGDPNFFVILLPPQCVGFLHTRRLISNPCFLNTQRALTTAVGASRGAACQAGVASSRCKDWHWTVMACLSQARWHFLLISCSLSYSCQL